MLRQGMDDMTSYPLSLHNDSIPRLELTAARLAVQVRQMLVDEVGELFERIFHWTDSECVLKQIMDRKTRYKTFVHNRLSVIRELSDIRDWHFVDTKNNPSDDCS